MDIHVAFTSLNRQDVRVDRPCETLQLFDRGYIPGVDLCQLVHDISLLGDRQRGFRIVDGMSLIIVLLVRYVRHCAQSNVCRVGSRDRPSMRLGGISYARQIPPDIVGCRPCDAVKIGALLFPMVGLLSFGYAICDGSSEFPR